MKAIVLTTTAYAVIAIVAVLLFISFLSSLFPEVGKNIYCQLYQAANAIIFLGSRPPLPEECTIQPKMERITIGYDSVSKLSEKTADLIFNCWEKSQHGTSGSVFICYEIYYKEVPGTIEEDEVNVFLVNDNKCDILPNNFLDLEKTGYACGTDNKIQWESDISAGTFIIKYDAFIRKIVVK